MLKEAEIGYSEPSITSMGFLLMPFTSLCSLSASHLLVLGMAGLEIFLF
jgi:hypothetical protein